MPTEPKDQLEFSGTMAPKSSTFITYLQILSVSDSAFNIPWPKGFLAFLRYLNPVNLDFFSISGLGCVVEYKFYDSHLFMVLLPVFIMLFIYLAYVLGLWRHRGYYKGRFHRDVSMPREAQQYDKTVPKGRVPDRKQLISDKGEALGQAKGGGIKADRGPVLHGSGTEPRRLPELETRF